MKVNQFKSGVMLSYLIILVGNIISVFYTPIMLRLLGQSEYGLLSMATSITAYLALLSFGFSASFIRYNARYRISGDKEGESNLNGMYMVVYTAIGILALICGMILVIYSDKVLGPKFSTDELGKAKILMAILVFNIAVSFPSSVFGMYNNAYEKFIFGRVLSLISTILNPLVMLPILYMGYGSVGMMLVQTIITILNTFAMIIYSKKILKMKITFKKFDTKIIKEIFIFSFYVFINMIADQINLNANKLIVGKIIGTVGVAIYTIGAQMNIYYISIAQAISNIFIPRVNNLVLREKDDSEVFKLFVRLGRVLFVVLMLFLSGFILIGKEFVMYWAGPDYIKSYYIALLLLIAATFSLVQSIASEIQRAKNIHKFRSFLLLGVALGNVALSIPLCIKYGEIGGAIGAAFVIIIGNFIVLNIYYKKSMDFDMFGFWKELFKLIPAAVIAMVLGFTVKYFLHINGLLGVAVCALCYTIIYSIAMWLIGMNEYEKKLISGPAASILKRLKNVCGKSAR
jgi:O-antigen/teichoic acid export membrane protein